MQTPWEKNFFEVKEQKVGNLGMDEIFAMGEVPVVQGDFLKGETELTGAIKLTVACTDPAKIDPMKVVAAKYKGTVMPDPLDSENKRWIISIDDKDVSQLTRDDLTKELSALGTVTTYSA